jgi:hypothetical protein
MTLDLGSIQIPSRTTENVTVKAPNSAVRGNAQLGHGVVFEAELGGEFMKRLVVTALFSAWVRRPLVGVRRERRWRSAPRTFDALVRRADHWKSYSLRDTRHSICAGTADTPHERRRPDSGSRTTPSTIPIPTGKTRPKFVVPAFAKWTTILT